MRRASRIYKNYFVRFEKWWLMIYLFMMLDLLSRTRIKCHRHNLGMLCCLFRKRDGLSWLLLFWGYVSSFLKYKLNLLSPEHEESDLFLPPGGHPSVSTSLNCVNGNSVSTHNGIVPGLLAKILKITCTHISSYCVNRFASILLESIDPGATTIFWSEDYPSLPKAPDTKHSQRNNDLDKLTTEDELSAFESWLVAEHFKRGFDSQWLSLTFSKAIFVGNGLVAIIAGLFGNFLVDSLNLGPVSPFDAAACFLAIGMAIILSSWSENYGDASVSKDLLTQFKSAYFQLAHRSLRSLGASQVHPKNWYPIPLIFCRPWGKLPENVPCHPKLADFANCMKKKGRGMSIFISIIDGDYHERAEDAKTACRQLSTYIDYKQCEGVAEIVVAPNMSEHCCKQGSSHFEGS